MFPSLVKSFGARSAPLLFTERSAGDLFTCLQPLKTTSKSQVLGTSTEKALYGVRRVSAYISMADGLQRSVSAALVRPAQDEETTCRPNSTQIGPRLSSSFMNCVI